MKNGCKGGQGRDDVSMTEYAVAMFYGATAAAVLAALVLVFEKVFGVQVL